MTTLPVNDSDIVDAIRDEFFWNPPCAADGASSALVIIAALVALVGVPGFALATAGASRRRSALSLLSQSIAIMMLGSLVWFGVGFSMVFGTSRAGFIGDLDWAFMAHPLLPGCHAKFLGVPLHATLIFQLFFAVLVPVGVAAQFGDRLTVQATFAFSIFFPVLGYYFPAHWILNPYGWLATRSAVDYAGGITVFMLAGIAAFISSLMVAPRGDGERTGNHNGPLFVVGSVLGWLGIYALIAGSSFQSNAQAGIALVNAHIAASAGAVTWGIAAYGSDRHYHLNELALGANAGLAAIASGAGYVQSYSALVIGIVTSLIAFFSHRVLNERLRRYDVLSIASTWGVAGGLGGLAVAFFADSRISGSLVIEGFFRDPSIGKRLLVGQFVAVITIGIWAAAMAWVCMFLTKYLFGLGQPSLLNVKGLDRYQIGRNAYDSSLAPNSLDWSTDQAAAKLAQVCQAGDTIVLDDMLRDGLSAHDSDFRGRTPAHYAAAAGRLNVLQYLKRRHNVNLNPLDDNQQTPLSDAVNANHMKTAAWLRQNQGKMPNEKNLNGALMKAARYGNLDEVTRLVQIGARIDTIDYDARTPLMIAATNGHLDIVDFLLDTGRADPTRRDRWGRTALDEAREFRNPAVAHSLLDVLSRMKTPEAAAIMQRDMGQKAEKKQTRSLIAAAAIGDNQAIRDTLNQYPSLVNGKDYDGRTPLHLAAAGGHLETCAMLLDSGASVNTLDRHRRTPLQDALSNNHLLAAQLLKQRGAVVTNAHLGHVLCSSAAYGWISTFDRYAHRGVDINTADPNGRTALHVAACMDKLEVVNWLVRNGAFANVIDRYGNTPLDDANRHNHAEVAQVLAQFGGRPRLALDAAIVQRRQQGRQPQAAAVNEVEEESSVSASELEEGKEVGTSDESSSDSDAEYEYQYEYEDE